MQVYYTNDHHAHHPLYEIWNGNQDQHQEVPARADTILSALNVASGFELSEMTKQLPLELLQRVHDRSYIQYLENQTANISAGQFQYPSVFPLRASQSIPTNALATQGYYSFDMYTPLLPATYQVALNSASLAWQVADDVGNGTYRTGYALCRPPGHHAEYDQMGGYCYFNNAAIAAEHLLQFGKVATLDVDFHHGNGTQHIYYERNDVLTVSIHADPSWKFPHMSGFEVETGHGEGRNFNRNYVLQQGTTNDQYQKVLEQALDLISEFQPDFLVVSFGADTYHGDPIGGFALTTDYFTTMAQTIDQMKLPTVIVQEGGYNCAELGTNVVAFLRGFE